MPSFKFKACYRLTENNRIRELYRLGKKIRSSFANIYFHANTLDYPRLCISISRKQVSKAVVRNQIKRRIRESFRHHADQLAAIDMVIVIYKNQIDFSPLQQREIFDYQWQRCRNA